MSTRKSIMVERFCEECHSRFYIKSHKLLWEPPRGRFCSRQCSGRSKRKTLRERFMQFCAPTSENGCVLWTGAKSEFGYGRIGSGADTGANKGISAHRAAWQFANGPIPDGLRVLHKCDVPSCVAIEHLFLGTDADNTNDMMEKGRGAIGPKAYGCKLADNDVRVIRERYAAGNILMEQLGQEYGVTKANIWCIIRRKSWKHIP